MIMKVDILPNTGRILAHAFRNSCVGISPVSVK